MLVVLDDLHWADVSSLLLLEFLAGEPAACAHDPAASGAGSSEAKRSSTFLVSFEMLLS